MINGQGKRTILAELRQEFCPFRSHTHPHQQESVVLAHISSGRGHQRFNFITRFLFQTFLPMFQLIYTAYIFLPMQLSQLYGVCMHRLPAFVCPNFCPIGEEQPFHQHIYKFAGHSVFPIVLRILIPLLQTEQSRCKPQDIQRTILVRITEMAFFQGSTY